MLGMKVAAIQLTPEFGRVEANLERAAQMIRRARVDLAVLPELAFTGYVFINRDELRDLSEPADGPSARFLQQLARETGTIICFGFPERAGEKIYNAAALVGPDGVLAVYRKVHLFKDELDVLDPGEQPFFVVDLGGVKVGMMICFDWVFPEAARSLALQGAQILLHPANLILPFCQDAMITRCLENKVFAITTNRGGVENRRDKPLTFTGRSQIARPNGEFQRLADDADDILVAEIDPQRALNKQMTDRNHLFADRRPRYYVLDKPEP